MRRIILGRGHALLMVAAIFVTGLPVAATARAGMPDLVVASVSAATEARQGEQLAVVDKVVNKGKAKAGKSSTVLYLSSDARKGGDVKLRPARSIGALRPKAASKGTTRVTIPATVEAGSYYVIACADGGRDVRESNEKNNCKASTTTVSIDPPPSSHDLIDADVAAGAIDEETGLVYKVYSNFFDPRLPAKYDRAAGPVTDGVLDDVVARWNELTPQTQELMRPFLLPPYYAGSHWSPDVPATKIVAQQPPQSGGSPWCSGSTDLQPLYSRFNHIDSADGRIRIWWLVSNDATDAATAARLMAELENKIMPALESLMGRGPLADDAGYCDGGSPALDIALADAKTATVYPDAPGCATQSTHMLFPRDPATASWAALDPYLAHEIMHTIQFAFPNGGCDANKWLREATAEWVQDYVTDNSYGIGVAPDDTEHQAAKMYLDAPEVSLEVPDESHDYAAYMFPFFVARETGSPAFIRSIWDNVAAGKSSLDAVDDAGSGAFRKYWADFALANWNDGPIDDYKKWDGLTHRTPIAGNIAVPVGKQTAAIPVDHLAAQYAEVQVHKDVTELEYTNDKVGDPDHGVWAVVYYNDGSHKVIDIGAHVAREKTVICIDDGTKRAQKVILVYSYSAKSGSTTFNPTLEGKKECGCPNATATRAVAKVSDSPLAQVCTAEGNFRFSFTETIHKPESEGEQNTQTEYSGTIQLNMVADDGDPDSYHNENSTYSVTGQRHFEWWRHNHDTTGCLDYVSDSTESGSGALEDDTVYGNILDDEFWLVSMIMLPTTRVSDWEQVCINSGHDETEDYIITPECPFDIETWNTHYVMTKADEDSQTYTFDCSSDEEWEDGMGRHQVHAEVSGTITLNRSGP